MTDAAEATEIVWRGASALRPFLVPIESLEPFPGNPKVGDLPAIRASLRRFGQTRAILLDGTHGTRIVAGHHLRLAAQEEGWTHVAAIPNEFADEDEARAYLLADNRTGEMGTYDLEELHARLREAQTSAAGLEGIGYADDHLTYLDRQIAQLHRAATPPDAFPPLDPDAMVTEYRCPSCSYEWSGNPKPGGDADAEAEAAEPDPDAPPADA